MTDFDLRAVAREVISDDTSESFAVMLKELRRRIPKDAVDAALNQTLPVYLHAMLRSPVTIPEPDSKPPARQPRPSPKVQTVREEWRRRLDQHYRIEDGHQRRIGDMTADNLTYVAGHLFELADQNRNRGDWFLTLRSAVVKAGVKRVRDLPAAKLKPLLDAAA